MIRIAALLLVGLSLGAQDLEEFKLRDGRTIVGNYDPQTKRMQAHSGGGFIGFTIEPDQIVSRRPYIARPAPNPAPVAEPPPSPPKEVRAPEPVAPTPRDPFVMSADDVRRETERWDALQARQAPLTDVFREMNPCSTAMLRAKAREDFPLRYRCFVTLADPAPVRHQVTGKTKWILAAFDASRECFGFFLVDRNSAEGKRIEQLLQKEPFVALHAWINRRPGSDEDFVVERIVADHWNPRADQK